VCRKTRQVGKIYRNLPASQRPSAGINFNQRKNSTATPESPRFSANNWAVEKSFRFALSLA